MSTRSRGLTLPELLLVMALFSSVVTLYLFLHHRIQRADRTSQAKNQAETEVALTLQRVRRELLNAQLSGPPTAPDLLTYRLPKLSNGRADTDASGALIWVTGNYSWRMESGKLVRVHPSEPKKVLGDLGSGQVQVTLPDTRLVRISLEARFQGQPAYLLSTSILLQ